MPRKTNHTTFKIESRGIDIIPESERYSRPRDLFSIWFVAQLTMSFIIFGQMFISYGFNFVSAIGICAFLAVSFVVVGISGVPGPKTGTATLIISRSAYGVRGNSLPSFFSWLILVGWESVTIVLTTDALLTLAKVVSLPSTGTVPTLISLLISLVVTFSVPLIGHAFLVKAQLYLSYIVGILSAGLLIIIIPKVRFGVPQVATHFPAHGLWPSLVYAVSVGLMATSMSWTNYGADYTRYMPSQTKARSIIVNTLSGAAIGAFGFLFIGVLLGTFVSSSAWNSNPIAAITSVLPNWFGVPFLLVVIFGQVANNYMNSYSSSMSLMSIGIKMKRYQSVLLDATLTTLAAVYGLFISSTFIQFFENFLGLGILFLGPWTGIYFAHHWVNRGQYHASSLVDRSPNSKYWYYNGFNWKTIVILLIGMVAAFVTANSALWQSPLSVHLLGGMDMSSFVGPIVSGLLYWAVFRSNGQVITSTVSVEGTFL